MASKGPEGNHDWPTYLCPLGTADIFFPTDFAWLARAYAATTGRACTTLLQRDFLLAYARDPTVTATRNGDNPMLDDYSNMSVLMTAPGGGSAAPPLPGKASAPSPPR